MVLTDQLSGACTAIDELEIDRQNHGLQLCHDGQHELVCSYACVTRCRCVVPANIGKVSCAAAIKAAAPGDRLIVAEGIYSETLLIDKALEIVGLAHPSCVCIQAINATAVTVSRAACRLENITLRVCGENCSDRDYCLANSSNSHVQLERCILEGGDGGLVNSGMAVLVATEIKCSQGSGVIGCEQSSLWMLQSSVHSHALSGISIQVCSGCGQREIAHAQVRARVHQ